MTELPLLRFIPFRRSDILKMCLSQERVDEAGQHQMRLAAKQIDDYFQRNFHQVKRQLKDAYAPLDPDADTRTVIQLREDDTSSDLVATLGLARCEGENWQAIVA